jgi:hypothetical protein
VPDGIYEALCQRQSKTKDQYDKTAVGIERSFKKGEKVAIKTTKRDHWEPGVIVDKDVNPRSYIVKNSRGNCIRRNTSQSQPNKSLGISNNHYMILEDNQVPRAMKTNTSMPKGHTAINKEVREKNTGVRRNTARSGRVVKTPECLDM